jgi:hypothetical protein
VKTLEEIRGFFIYKKFWFGSRLNVVWQFVLHLPDSTAHTLKLVWHLPINITTGPELEFNWFKVANQYRQRRSNA